MAHVVMYHGPYNKAVAQPVSCPPRLQHMAVEAIPDVVSSTMRWPPGALTIRPGLEEPGQVPPQPGQVGEWLRLVFLRAAIQELVGTDENLALLRKAFRRAAGRTGVQSDLVDSAGFKHNA